MQNHKTFIISDGLPFIIPLGILTLVIAIMGYIISAYISFSITAFVIWFFRNPNRRVPVEEHLIISPADGKVIIIENVTLDNFVQGHFKKISIFMNVFNVHVNRIPYSGKVTSIHYKKGKFISANLDKASSLNEQNAAVIATSNGKEIVIVQIAGLIARRIVCWIQKGMHVTKGERFGLIRFGSRVDVYLPECTNILRKVGDKVKAGETPLGEFP